MLRKLKVLVAIRVFFISILLAAFFILRLEFRFFPYSKLLLLLTMAIYSLSISYLLLIRSKKIAPGIQAYIQLVLDAISAVVLIMATGGIESWFTVILVLVVISASIVLDKRAGFIVATLGGISYGIAIDLQFYRIIPIEYSPFLTEKNFLYNIVINLSAVYLSAYLTGHLSSGLEKTKEILHERSSDLNQLASFHEDVIENITSGLFYADIDGNMKLFNRTAELICEISRDRALKMSVGEIFPFVRFPIRPGRYDGKIDLVGRTKYIGMSISIHDSPEQREVGYIGTFQDLTEIRRLEAEIKRKEKFAAIGELSANIAHEIRNPLASIKGSVELIREDRVKNADRTKLMDIAVSEMNRLNDIITNFLNYSNPKPFSFRKVDLSSLLSGTTVLLKTSLESKPSISLIENIQPFLYAEIDEDKIRQVFWNLLANSVEALKGEGSIIVSAAMNGNFVVIDVNDTGEGIKPEDTERIFYPFYTTKKTGTGLGLAIAYRIIEGHSGSIDVKSEPGNGTSFRIRLPVKQESNGKNPDR